MKCKIGILMFFLSIIFLSCNTKVGKNKELLNTKFKNSVDLEENKSLKLEKEIIADIYFKASGTEPFWGLEISDDHIKLTTIGDSIIAPSTNSIHAMDANVKRYKIQTELA